MYSVGKKNTRKFNVGAKSSIQRDEKFKEKSDEKWNKGSHSLRTRPHTVKFPTCKKEMPK